jgi:hypothetical protein
MEEVFGTLEYGSPEEIRGFLSPAYSPRWWCGRRHALKRFCRKMAFFEMPTGLDLGFFRRKRFKLSFSGFQKPIKNSSKSLKNDQNHAFFDQN